MSRNQELTKTKTARIERENLFQAETEELQMGINMNAIGHIINRLTELYPNPIKATARELISNAYDALVESTKANKRIEVSLPTKMSPSFIVRDNGVGMSTEVIKNIYSLYGASTKAENFNQVGAYGLGAKAPLSYCTDFTVESTYEGIKTTVLVTKREDGNFLEIVGVEETTEESGTKVTVPALHDDMQSFRDVIESHYQPFTMKDIRFFINGEERISNSYVLVDDEVLIHEATGTMGRLWVNTANLYSVTHRDLIDEIDYVIGGWKYPINRRFSRGNHESMLILELKPGVVDFNSSRDDIVTNERYDALVKLIESNDEKIYASVMNKILSLDLSLVAKVIHNNPRALIEYEPDNYEDAILRIERAGFEDYTVKLKDVNTADGYNLSDILAPSDIKLYLTYQKELRTHNIGLTYYEKMLHHNPEKCADKVSVNGHAFLTYSSSIANVNEHFELSLRGEFTHDFNKHLFYLAHYERYGVTDLIIYTDVSEKNANKIKANRKALFERAQGRYQSIMLVGSTFDEVNAAMSSYYSESGLITVINVNDAIAEITAKRREAAKERKKSNAGAPKAQHDEESFVWDHISFPNSRIKHESLYTKPSQVESYGITHMFISTRYNEIPLRYAFGLANKTNTDLKDISIGVIHVNDLRSLRYADIQPFAHLLAIEANQYENSNPTRYKTLDNAIKVIDFEPTLALKEELVNNDVILMVASLYSFTRLHEETAYRAYRGMDETVDSQILLKSSWGKVTYEVLDTCFNGLVRWGNTASSVARRLYNDYWISLVDKRMGPGTVDIINEATEVVSTMKRLSSTIDTSRGFGKKVLELTQQELSEADKVFDTIIAKK